MEFLYRFDPAFQIDGLSRFDQTEFEPGFGVRRMDRYRFRKLAVIANGGRRSTMDTLPKSRGRTHCRQNNLGFLRYDAGKLQERHLIVPDLRATRIVPRCQSEHLQRHQVQAINVVRLLRQLEQFHFLDHVSIFPTRLYILQEASVG